MPRFRFFLFLAVLFSFWVSFFTNCARPNKIVGNDEDDWVIISDSTSSKKDTSKDTSDEQVIVVKEDSNGVVVSKDSALVEFDIDIFEINTNEQSLKKRMLNRTALADYRKSQSVQVYFIFSDSSGNKKEYTFVLKDGKCSGNIMVLPKKYFVETYLRYSTTCPWDASYSLIDAPFMARDTIICQSGKTASLDLMFKELTALYFFFELTDPIGVYVEGSKYTILESTGSQGKQALYTGGKLKHWLYVDITMSATNIRVIDSKKDTNSIGLVFDLDNYVTNNKVVPISGSSIKITSIGFDYQKPLVVSSIIPWSGGIKILYGKGSLVSTDSLFEGEIKKIIGSDSTRIDATGWFNASNGCLWWHKKSTLDHLTVGTYTIKINRAIDEYGIRQTVQFSGTINVTVADIPPP